MSFTKPGPNPALTEYSGTTRSERFLHLRGGGFLQTCRTTRSERFLHLRGGGSYRPAEQHVQKGFSTFAGGGGSYRPAEQHVQKGFSTFVGGFLQTCRTTRSERFLHLRGGGVPTDLQNNTFRKVSPPSRGGVPTDLQTQADFGAIHWTNTLFWVNFLSCSNVLFPTHISQRAGIRFRILLKFILWSNWEANESPVDCT